jgi:hypothetical protein
MTEDANYTAVYANKSRILSQITHLPQAPRDETIEAGMQNADSIINSKLGENNIPTYNRGDEIPGILKTAACYYAISDILRPLYGKDDRSSNEQGYREDAENLVWSFIQQMKAQDESVIEDYDPYGISQSPDAFDLGLLHR